MDDGNFPPQRDVIDQVKGNQAQREGRQAAADGRTARPTEPFYGKMDFHGFSLFPLVIRPEMVYNSTPAALRRAGGAAASV